MPAPSTSPASVRCPTQLTFWTSTLPTSPPPTAGSVATPTRISPSPVADAASPATAASSSSDSSNSPERYVRRGSSWRMSQACFRFAEAATSVPCSAPWKTQGTLQRGECWTRNGSACPSVGAVSSSLPDVLEPADQIPQRYYLSPRACRGVIRRAARRGKTLPARLQQALEAVASVTSTRES